MQSIIKKFKNIETIIYFDITAIVLSLIGLIYSLLPNSFNIVPIKLVRPFLGVNRLKDIIESLHYILIGISITFIIQSVILLLEYKKNHIQPITIMNLLFYKWVILTINTAVPYAFNVQTTPIFIFLSIIILFLFWYLSLDYV